MKLTNQKNNIMKNNKMFVYVFEQNVDYNPDLCATCLHRRAYFKQNSDYKLVLGATCPHKMTQRVPDCSKPK